MDFTLLFMYFITVNKYRFWISVIKNQYRSITSVDNPHRTSAQLFVLRASCAQISLPVNWISINVVNGNLLLISLCDVWCVSAEISYPLSISHYRRMYETLSNQPKVSATGYKIKVYNKSQFWHCSCIVIYKLNIVRKSHNCLKKK